MTVTASPKDVAGQNLQTKITSITAQAALVKTTSTAVALAAALDQSQREAVYHFIEHGRLPTASMILTMLGSQTVTPSGLDPAGVLMFKNIVSTATRVAALKAGAVQEAGNRILDQLQREMMFHCLETGFVTASQILSNMS